LSSDVHGVELGLERARALCELRRFPEAIELLQQLLGRDPDSATGWCLLAQAQLGVGDAYAVLDAASHGTALAPEDEWPHRLRSIAFEELGVPDSAIAAAREAVRVGPHTWQAHSHLATALVIAKRDLGEAGQAAERGVALAPHEPDAHYALGLVADARGDHRVAEEHFRRALALDPQHGPTHNARARRRLASSRFHAGKLADAAAGFRDVVQADPRADYAARNLEVVLRVFLARLSYLIFVIVVIAARADHLTSGTAGGTDVARIVPVLLAVPIAYAVYFVVRLEPDLRGHLLYVAFHGRLGAASIAQVCAIALLLASAAAPTSVRIGLVIAAFFSSLLARLILAVRGSGRILAVGDWRDHRVTLSRRWVMTLALVVMFLILGWHNQ
jgi:tetratricopeptide (TPR) repeat protein